MGRGGGGLDLEHPGLYGVCGEDEVDDGAGVGPEEVCGAAARCGRADDDERGQEVVELLLRDVLGAAAQLPLPREGEVLGDHAAARKRERAAGAVRWLVLAGGACEGAVAHRGGGGAAARGRCGRGGGGVAAGGGCGGGW